MKNKRNVLYSVIIFLVICSAVHAQQKNGAHRASFSGEWKSKESISMGGNVVCLYDRDDRMRSKTMKIVQQADFITIEVPTQSSNAAMATSKEKLALDGKTSLINDSRGLGKKFTVKLSADGQTMTVNSIVHLMVATRQPFYGVNFSFSRPTIDPQNQELVNVTEVWKLSNDGKSISVQTNTKSTRDVRSWKTVFYKSS